MEEENCLVDVRVSPESEGVKGIRSKRRDVDIDSDQNSVTTRPREDAVIATSSTLPGMKKAISKRRNWEGGGNLRRRSSVPGPRGLRDGNSDHKEVIANAKKPSLIASSH
jgi:hypothetical protein